MTTPSHDPPEERFVYVNLRMTEDLRDRLAAIAKRRHRSLRGQILAMVEADLEHVDPPPAAPQQ